MLPSAYIILFILPFHYKPYWMVLLHIITHSAMSTLAIRARTTNTDTQMFSV